MLFISNCLTHQPANEINSVKYISSVIGMKLPSHTYTDTNNGLVPELVFPQVGQRFHAMEVRVHDLQILQNTTHYNHTALH